MSSIIESFCLGFVDISDGIETQSGKVCCYYLFEYKLVLLSTLST